MATNDFQAEKRRPCLGVCHHLGVQKLYPGTLILPWSLILERNEKVVADIFSSPSVILAASTVKVFGDPCCMPWM